MSSMLPEHTELIEVLQKADEHSRASSGSAADFAFVQVDQWEWLAHPSLRAISDESARIEEDGTVTVSRLDFAELEAQGLIRVEGTGGTVDYIRLTAEGRASKP